MTFAGVTVLFVGLLIVGAPAQNEIQQLGSKTNDFTMAMYQILKSTPGNLFFSPLSCHTVLSMLYPGSSGKTKDEFKTGLRLGNIEDQKLLEGYSGLIEHLKSEDQQLVLDIANKIFMAQDYVLKEKYVNEVKQYFQTAIEKLNFGESAKATSTINKWVESKTNNKIKDLIPPNTLDSSTRAVLVNAIYFKGLWVKQFEKKDTKKQPFFQQTGGQKMVDMMKITSNYMYGEVNTDSMTAQVLEMPYKGTPNVSMVIVLPGQGVPIEKVEDNLGSLSSNTKMYGMTKVVVSLPKFKIEQTIGLNEILKKMGLVSMFGNGAQFTELSEEPVKVDKVIQKAFIDVNEEGTEAAAATAVIIGTTSVRDPVDEIKVFKANRPFRLLPAR